MNSLFQAASEVSEFLQHEGWKFCIIGGLAVQQWGEPRTTLDVDITLLANWGEEEDYIDCILKHFSSRTPDARSFALEFRVLLIKASNGRDIDLSLGALPFEIEMISRSTDREFAPGINLPCCTAEDLFILKAFAGRPRDWQDAESIAIRQIALDTDYIFQHLELLAELKQAPEIITRARAILNTTL